MSNISFFAIKRSTFLSTSECIADSWFLNKLSTTAAGVTGAGATLYLCTEMRLFYFVLYTFIYLSAGALAASNQYYNYRALFLLHEFT